MVAAENFWGSIAGQIGGKHVQVTSIISNPDTDPHSYEPTTADARALAGAQFVIENGIGYDPWVPKLLAADGSKPPRARCRRRRGRRRRVATRTGGTTPQTYSR